MFLEEILHPAIISFAVISLLHLILFLGYYYRLVYPSKKKEVKGNKAAVSVIITAKDEEENLKANLPAFLDQDYPEFEVIVVNDQSEDDTEDVLDRLSAENKRLQIVRIGHKLRKWPGKKLAISLGIRRAQYDYLILSDADCRPASDKWIASLMSNYDDDKEIVLGVSPYLWKPTFLNKIIQFDTLMTISNYVGFTLAKIPYMGVGRNLSYKRELYEKTGFGRQLHVPYGDDDLFVNEAANKINTTVEFSRESLVFSQPKENFGKWFRQKYRHLSAGRSYKFGHKLLLTLAAFIFPAFFISLALAVIFAPISYLFFGILGLRYLVVLLYYGLIAKRYSRTSLIFWIPLLELFYHIILLPYFSIYLMIRGGQKGW